MAASFPHSPLPLPHAACNAVSMHNDMIVHAHRIIPRTRYLLPWPTVYYKCVAQIAETITEFSKSKTRAINKNDNWFFDYFFTSLLLTLLRTIVSTCYSLLTSHNYMILVIFGNISLYIHFLGRYEQMQHLPKCIFKVHVSEMDKATKELVAFCISCSWWRYIRML